MNWINVKSKELQSIIENINGCYTTENQSGYTLNSKSGVIWANTKRGKKWGKVFEEDRRLYVVIDFPSSSYEISDLAKRIGLNERDEDEQATGIRLRINTPFDSVQIALYDFDSATIFKSESFVNFVYEVATKVKA